MYEHLSEKLEKDYSITLREREFVEEYEALLQTMGKDAVIRRENKTKPRKKRKPSLTRPRTVDTIVIWLIYSWITNREEQCHEESL